MHNVLVTGGSRGIGLAIARRLAGAGYNVIAVARRESDELKAATGEIVRQGRGGLHFRAFDLSEVDAIPAFVKELRDEFGAIYGLVNNAGIGTEGLLATMHNSEIEALLRLNVLSPVILTKYVVRHMMADGAGRIINMSSIIATTGYNGLSVYGATKAAATGFTKSLAREVGKLGITVNAIAPGFIDTELTQSLSDDQRKRIASRSALRRLPEADDVARMVEYLLGDGGPQYHGVRHDDRRRQYGLKPVSATARFRGHDYSLDRPENAPDFDVFGHNPKRPLTHANVGRYFNSGADRDRWGSLHRSAIDQSAGRATGELKPPAGRLGVMSWGHKHAFRGSISQTDQHARGRGGISDRIPGLAAPGFSIPRRRKNQAE